MAGLQVLEDELGPEGFHVLGFFSNDFGNQGGSSDDIDACNLQHMTSFRQFDIAHVIDPDGDGPEVPQPVWAWLLAQPSPGPAEPLAPAWNFHKYIVSKEGVLVAHHGQSEYWGTDPTAEAYQTNPVVQDIRAELAR